jgi:hypothetical protein
MNRISLHFLRHNSHLIWTSTDIAEQRNIGKEKSEVVAEIQQTIERHQQTLTTTY